jgi:vancomycin permeability regulator SanA
LGPQRHRLTGVRFLKGLTRVLGSLVLVAALLVAGSWATAKIMSWGQIKTVQQVPSTDVTIVFGTSAPNGQPSNYLANRLNIAEQLYKAGKTKVILVSGSTDVGYSEPETMQKELVAAGVPAERIVMDTQGDDTWSTCQRANKVYGVRDAILVSQTYHLNRALATCRMNGVSATGVGDDTLGGGFFTYRNARELAGDTKMLWDWATGRKVDLTPSDAVQKALQAAA